MTKDELISELEIRATFTVNDCQTFYSAKIHNCCRGGGNFLSVLGGFSLLNLLSKVNSILNGAAMWSDDDRRQANIVKAGIASEAKKYFRLPRVGDLKKNEDDCFVELFEDTRLVIPWGFDDSHEAKSVWASYRNKLAHVASPASGAAALAPNDVAGLQFEELVIAIKTSKYNIYDYHSADSPDGKVISAEKLNESLHDIWETVKDKINTCSDSKIISNIAAMVF